MRRRYMAGDVVARRKGPVMHKGIALGDGRVLHNTPRHGEHISSEEDFLQGRTLYVINKPRPERRRALAHANNLRYRDVGEFSSYNLFTNNCEHTVNRAHSGRSHSPQLAGWLAGLSLAVVALITTRHPAIIAAGFSLGKTLGTVLKEE